ncbi:MAG TPA: hypothetical protein VL485_26555 [Ktedonobacteraceae bacterium]|jgi:hypothetical protein|nr:hypothetical protein [Ktedonobacteraceae bacterium]
MKYRRLLIYIAVALAFIVELFYLWELPTNFELWWVYGTFMLIAAMIQGAGAVMLLFWPRLRLIGLFLLGNVLLIAGYLVIRVLGDSITLGMPPLASEKLNLGIVAIEIVIIGLLIALFRQGLRRRRAERPPGEGSEPEQPRETYVQMKPAVEPGTSESVNS